MLPTLPNVKNFSMKTGKLKVFISMNLILVLTIKGDGQFEKSGNSALVFQHLSFQSYHVIHQQELNTLKH